MSAKGRSQDLKPEASGRTHKQRINHYQGKGGTVNRWCMVGMSAHRSVMYRAVCVALLGTVFMLMVQGDVLLTDSVTSLLS